MQSVSDAGIAVDLISMSSISEKNIGGLLLYFELLTSLLGSMFGINTYNQPGVELGKQILYKNLGES